MDKNQIVFMNEILEIQRESPFPDSQIKEEDVRETIQTLKKKHILVRKSQDRDNDSNSLLNSSNASVSKIPISAKSRKQSSIYGSKAHLMSKEHSYSGSTKGGRSSPINDYDC